MSKIIEKNILQCQENLKEYALHLTCDIEAANELLQETVFKIWNKKESYSIGTDFLAWSRTIMVNTFRNQFRSKQRRKEILNKKGTLQYLYNENMNINKGEWLLYKEEIEKGLNSLDEKFRVPIKMQKEGYPYAEIMEYMEVSNINTLKSRIHYGRKKLKKILEYV